MHQAPSPLTLSYQAPNTLGSTRDSDSSEAVRPRVLAPAALPGRTEGRVPRTHASRGPFPALHSLRPRLQRLSPRPRRAPFCSFTASVSVYRHKCTHLNNPPASVQTPRHAGRLLTAGDRGSAPAHQWDAGSVLSELLVFKEAKTPDY